MPFTGSIVATWLSFSHFLWHILVSLMSHLGAHGKMLGHVANFAILSALIPSIAFPAIGKGLHYLKKKILNGEILGLLQQLGQI